MIMEPLIHCQLTKRLSLVPRGRVYIVKIRGPRIQYDTKNRHRTRKKASLIDSLWESYFKYDRNHSNTLPDKPNIFPIDKTKQNNNIVISCVKCSRQVQKDHYYCFTLIKDYDQFYIQNALFQ